MTCWLRLPGSTELVTAWSLKSVVVDPWRLQGLLVSSAAWPVLVAWGQGRQWCGPQTAAAGDSEDYRQQWQLLASWQRLASNTCIMVEARVGRKGGAQHKNMGSCEALGYQFAIPWQLVLAVCAQKSRLVLRNRSGVCRNTAGGANSRGAQQCKPVWVRLRPTSCCVGSDCQHVLPGLLGLPKQQ